MSKELANNSLKKSASNHLILFRKESNFVLEDKENNSMVIMEKDNKLIKFNVSNKGFFDKKKITKNINNLKKEFELKKENINIQNKEAKGSANDNENCNNTIEGINKRTLKLEDNDAKIVKSENAYNILSSSKRSLEHKDSKLNSKINDEILLIKSKKIKEKNMETRIKDLKLIDNNDHKSEFESIEFPYKLCLICDVYFTSNQIVYLECEHIFCINCIKLFFEEKIEEGKKQLKCPLFKCLTEISSDIVKRFVTEKHFINLMKKIEVNEEKLNFVFNDEKGTFNFGKKPTTIIENNDFKMYSRKHVFEVTNSINFLYYSKTKEIFCKNCNEESLFGRNCRNFIKCMNCLHSYCKYCGKNYATGHFDFTGNSYCKIFFRRHCKYLPTNRSKCKEQFFEFLVFLAGYIIFFIGILNFVSISTSKLVSNDKNSTWKFLLQMVLLMLLYSIIIPILFLILPFYPYVIAMFR